MNLKPFNRCVITLKSGSDADVRKGYPWIFRRHIAATGISGNGDVVDVVDSNGEFLGRGYYNAMSGITVRLLTFKDEAIDRDFFRNRIAIAFSRRKDILTTTNAYRAVFSEADSLAGLVVDIYADVAVFQVGTLGIERFKEDIVEAIKDVFNLKYIYERSDFPARQDEGLALVKKWWSVPYEGLVEIFEGKAKFLVDVENGHKTGFYLDQRKARRSLHGMCKGKKVLDLFSYCGGFAINAALSGAESVMAVDIKDEWLELGKKNAQLNGVADKISFVKADVFNFLRNMRSIHENFDIIILDPPSFLKSRHKLADAIRGYREINISAMRILNPDGILATFSCSHNMPFEAFSELLKEAAVEVKRTYSILSRCHQDKDHPFVQNIPETNYLKGYFLKVSGT